LVPAAFAMILFADHELHPSKEGLFVTVIAALNQSFAALLATST
jgi:hypothetical protein